MLEHDAFQPLTCRENGTAFLTVGQKQSNDILEVASQFIHPAAGEDRVSQSSALDHCISSDSLSHRARKAIMPSVGQSRQSPRTL